MGRCSLGRFCSNVGGVSGLYDISEEDSSRVYQGGQGKIDRDVN